MEDDIRMRDQLSYQEKNRQLYIRQKEMLALFLQKRAISQEQYEKSLHDLTEKMGYCGTNYNGFPVIQVVCDLHIRRMMGKKRP